MFRNYLKIALRNISRNKLHATINIFGLAMGFVMAILSYLYIANEVSYETWIPDNDRIYRAYRALKSKDGGHAYTSKLLAPFLAEEIAGVEKATCVYEEWRMLLTKEDKSIYVNKSANVDSSFFEVFKFPFKYGDPTTAMDRENSMVISERLAKLFFGEANPIGELIKGDGNADYVITGVLSGNIGDSYVHYEVYTPFYQTWMNQWLNNSVTTYILKAPNSSIDQIAERTDIGLFPIFQREMNENNMNIEKLGDLNKWKFQPLTNIHLLSEDMSTVRASNGNIQKLYLYGIIAFIVLLIACINYLNLATAKAAGRAKEVGMRKVSGAKKSQLISQFLIESTLQALFALGIAFVLSEFLLPIFNLVTDRELTFLGDNFIKIIGPMLGVGLVVGLLAGLYPAFFLANFKPVKILKGKVFKTSSGQSFRKGLVISQFTMTLVLMIVMAFVYKQINFMQSQELGFNGQQVVSVEINQWETPRKIQQRKSSLLDINGVEVVTLSSRIPGAAYSNYTMYMEGKEGNQSPDMLFVTPDYAQTMGLEMVEGRFFSWDFATDTANAFVVNETFLKHFDVEDPIGKGMNFAFEDGFGPIIGVVKDHHFEGLQDEIRPLAMSARQNINAFNYASFKLEKEHIPTTIAAIKKQWAIIEPTHPIQYSFLDEKFNEQYAENERFGRTILYATFFAIFIAILGLLGLASFMAEQRTKEIGVRKVLGASVLNLVNLLVIDFVKLVLVAGLIAIPFGYYLVDEWLTDFAFRTEINAIPFVLAIVGAIGLAIITVSFQAIKVSVENPVKALKTE